MAGVKRFQDLDCWKLARMLRREVVRLTAREPVRGEFRFVGQIRDAARGGTRNIAEGYSRFIPADILRYLSYAKSSLDEVADQLLDGLESGYWTRSEYNVARSLQRRAQGAIRGWWRYLESADARRFYEGHRDRIEREIKAGLRRPQKDPASRPWRRSQPPQTLNPQNPENLNPENPNPQNRNPRNPNPRNPNPRNPNPENPQNPQNPQNPKNP